MATTARSPSGRLLRGAIWAHDSIWVESLSQCRAPSQDRRVRSRRRWRSNVIEIGARCVHRGDRRRFSSRSHRSRQRAWTSRDRVSRRRSAVLGRSCGQQRQQRQRSRLGCGVLRSDRGHDHPCGVVARRTAHSAGDARRSEQCGCLSHSQRPARRRCRRDGRGQSGWGGLELQRVLRRAAEPSGLRRFRLAGRAAQPPADSRWVRRLCCRVQPHGGDCRVGRESNARPDLHGHPGAAVPSGALERRNASSARAGALGSRPPPARRWRSTVRARWSEYPGCAGRPSAA